ncbi:hypothetical protein [Streptomyces crystallinus]|uniref:Uncharacterized protein n=1 Tax=Streptomyces crystallinus TaxID=68191 RepID=A0ABN1GGT5_9ACTN
MSASGLTQALASQQQQPLCLDVLRHLVAHDWARLPGTTLVVLCTAPEGNGFSPFSTYEHARYAPEADGLRGEIYPLESDLAHDPGLRELFPQIPGNAVAALVIYPLG